MNHQKSSSIATAMLFLTTVSLLLDSAFGQSTPFSAPLRTIVDITAILDQETPNSTALAKNNLAAAEKPNGDLKGKALFTFYLERGRARSELGRLRDALVDGELALQIATSGLEFRDVSMALQFIIL